MSCQSFEFIRYLTWEIGKGSKCIQSYCSFAIFTLLILALCVALLSYWIIGYVDRLPPSGAFNENRGKILVRNLMYVLKKAKVFSFEPSSEGRLLSPVQTGWLELIRCNEQC